jgi:hypothetical protein
VTAVRTTPLRGALWRVGVTGRQLLMCSPPCEGREISTRLAALWKLSPECNPSRRSRSRPAGRTKQAVGQAAYFAAMLCCMAQS